jgi:cold shock CspA family protein
LIVTDQHGRVDAYDPRCGLGSVERDDGHRFGFHCTAITDGSRDIPVGATVTFRVVPGHLGDWEAATIRSA